MVFRNDIFNPIYESGDKITPDINPKCRCIGLVLTILERYDTSM